jgi:putative heme-binding domain-containing protein
MHPLVLLLALAQSPPSDQADRAPAIQALLAAARSEGDPARGAAVFASARHACISCHRVGASGGSVGPELTAITTELAPEVIAESLLWPAARVREGYASTAVATADGRLLQGYRRAETDDRLELLEPTSGQVLTLHKSEIEESRDAGTLMPEGLLAAMTDAERADLVRFLLDLKGPDSPAVAALAAHSHLPAAFEPDRAPLDPAAWPSRAHPVNRDRIYDFYAKEADHFAPMHPVPSILPAFPGMDGGRLGHWGNQNEETWKDDRWNRSDLGRVMSGVFRGAGLVVPKAVCVRLGERGDVSACFNPETLQFEAVWTGGFLRLGDVRHGIMDGLILDGTRLPSPEPIPHPGPVRYQGFYRHGDRVLFAYSIDGVDYLDAPWAEDGQFTRVVAPAATHPLAHLTRGGPARWPQELVTNGSLGTTRPFAVDTIAPPFDNPWKALLFFGDHDFLPDGDALLATIQGDVWRVSGLDGDLAEVRWRRVASGLHQPLGLVVSPSDGDPYVLGRDQITRLRDLDGDGEYDFHENFCNLYQTSPGGHDFICGLQRDAAGRFYTASGPQGILRVASDGSRVDVLATGFRNPDGLGLTPDGALTVPSSEGEWTPASMVSEVKVGGHYGYGGPRDLDTPPDLPLVYIPRGIDNSSGGQAFIDDDRFAGLKGQMVHLSFGAGTAFLLLRDRVDGQPQGALVPLPVEFRSGAHRARLRRQDGQLYVSGMAGWGTYTTDDGCFQRVRYAGGPVRLPTEIHAHANGVLVRFSDPVDPAVAGQPDSHFAQAWNYRYSPGYGSLELSARHPDTPGHDPIRVTAAHVLDDGRSVFLEMPELQPVNVLHLRLRPDSGPATEAFATVHRLRPDFTGYPGYTPREKVIAAHPILADMVALRTPPRPNPHQAPIPGARPITVEAGKNLSFVPRVLTVRAGEAIELNFVNPDAVPHNWTLIRPGSLARVGDLVNKLVAEPDAARRHYVPASDDVLAYTDITRPSDRFKIYFRAPEAPGRYPYLCTFPGHWMVMNGELVVEP